MSVIDPNESLAQSQYSGYGMMRGVGYMQQNRIQQQMIHQQQALKDSMI